MTTHSVIEYGTKEQGNFSYKDKLKEIGIETSLALKLKYKFAVQIRL